MSVPAGWSYSNSFSAERRAALDRYESFDALLAAVVADVQFVGAWPKPGVHETLTHCTQPVFSIKLPRTGDALFNGPCGYRAQYWHSPARGLAANAELIEALWPVLRDALTPEQRTSLTAIDLYTALHAASAKVWVVESSAYNDPPRDLAVERWLLAADAGNDSARKGLYAPDDGRFEVKGALFDAHRQEVVPRDKVLRHHAIHDYGFT
jgi:hypothetical protein